MHLLILTPNQTQQHFCLALQRYTFLHYITIITIIFFHILHIIQCQTPVFIYISPSKK